MEFSNTILARLGVMVRDVTPIAPLNSGLDMAYLGKDGGMVEITENTPVAVYNPLSGLMVLMEPDDENRNTPYACILENADGGEDGAGGWHLKKAHVDVSEGPGPVEFSPLGDDGRAALYPDGVTIALYGAPGRRFTVSAADVITITEKGAPVPGSIRWIDGEGGHTWKTVKE